MLVIRVYWILYVLPALGLLILAFVTGSHANPLFGLIGFVCFFTLAVTLVVEGWKRHRRRGKGE